LPAKIREFGGYRDCSQYNDINPIYPGTWFFPMRLFVDRFGCVAPDLAESACVLVRLRISQRVTYR
jgi:hypothetical protein